MNISIFSGNTTKDITVNSSNGTDYAHFTVASNYRYFDGETRREGTNFIPVTAFGKLARSLRSLGAGSRVEVRGHLKDSQYEREGVKVYTVEVIADDVDFVFVKKPAEAGDAEDSSEATES